MQVNPQPNAQRGTVDIEYVVEERSSDQLELSAGYQPASRIVSSGGLIGTLGLTFNNFSLRNIFNTKAWSPLPQGDGQRLSIRAQTNAQIYSSYNFSFTEPWLGGNKPNALTLSAFSTRNGSFFNVDQELQIQQASVGLGRRLQWPDDNFIMNTSLNFQNISINQWPGIFVTAEGNSISDGSFNNFFLQQTIARSTIADPIFPKEGSNISLTIQATLPYSLLNKKDYNDISDADRYQWVEYHKWKFNAEWYKSLGANFVLRASAKMGFLGRYSNEFGDSPFERFELGSEPLANQFTITGRDQIVSRGYKIEDFPEVGQTGASIFEKFTVELRYPLSLNPSSTIFLQTFLEGANAWNRFSNFNPLDLRRTVGAGVRVFLPMFGTLGFDYGIGFDKPNVLADPNYEFGQLGRFTLILGFEPE